MKLSQTCNDNLLVAMSSFSFSYLVILVTLDMLNQRSIMASAGYFILLFTTFGAIFFMIANNIKDMCRKGITKLRMLRVAEGIDTIILLESFLILVFAQPNDTYIFFTLLVYLVSIMVLIALTSIEVKHEKTSSIDIK